MHIIAIIKFTVSILTSLDFSSLFQEVEDLLIVDFGFVKKQLTDDITDEKLQELVGDPLLQELDTVSVEPIEAVQRLSKGELCIAIKMYYIIKGLLSHQTDLGLVL